MKQKRPCAFLECYRWAPGEWAAFALTPGTCGWGSRTRSLVCQRSDGKAFDESHCAGLQRPHEQVRVFPSWCVGGYG